ncbi:MAG: hypothetical protein IKV96_04735 [Firmicutes bacterium]|nr:hypothetical protein [Bacillota bacterium]
MKTSKLKIFFACIISILFVFSMTACTSRGRDISMEAVYEANQVEKIMENYKNIRAEFSYYENMDNVVTYNTFYCYSESGARDDGPVYVALGTDAFDLMSADNFRYAVVDNIEYYKGQTDAMIVYLLHPDYMTDFRQSTMTIFNSSFGKVISAQEVDSKLIITTESPVANVYGEATVSHLESICKNTLKSVQIEYTVDNETLLLHGTKTYLVSDEGTKFLFCEEKVTYDGNEPDLSFIDSYKNAELMRNVTVIECTPEGNTSHAYSIPANVVPNYQSFTSSHGYMIFSDSQLTIPYTGEVADPETENYADLTVYAGTAEALTQPPAPAENPAPDADGTTDSQPADSSADATQQPAA